MEGGEERGASGGWRRIVRLCLAAEQPGERQGDVRGALQERAGEVRRAPCTVEQIGDRGACTTRRQDRCPPDRRRLQAVLAGRGAVGVRGGIAVSVRRAGALLREQIRGRRALAAARVRVVVAVEAEVDARKDKRQREIKERGQRGARSPVPLPCTTR